MGIPMDENLHIPTIPSGPTSGGAPRDLSKLSMTGLMQEKTRIEEELSALSSVLTSQGTNMTSSLTTFDGYPRDDIDVAQVRTTRVRIIRLRNDHKDVMNHLEKGLHNHFANLQRTQATANGANGSNTAGTSAPHGLGDIDRSASDPGRLGTPFAKVNSVVPGSPADQAGLKAGDTIRSFGNVNWMNHERLSKVAEAVQQNEGRSLTVKVARKEDSSMRDLELALIPRRDWGGRGLLGCHLIPL